MKPVQSIQLLDRAAAVIEAVAAGDETGKRLIDVVQEVGLQKSTVHRLLNALERLGYVERDEYSARYFLGYRLFALGLTSAHRFGLARLAEQATTQLAALTSDTVFLSVRQGTHALCIDRAIGSYPIKTLTLQVGDIRPLGVGAGSLALLAWLPDDRIDAILEANRTSLTPYPGFDAATIRDLVAASRQQGHASNIGGIVPGMSAIGVPIRGRGGDPIGALSVAAIDSRMHPERRRQIVGWAMDQAGEIEARLGGPAGLAQSDVRHLITRF